MVYAYVRKGNLHVLGMRETPFGIYPFHVQAPIDDPSVPEGAVSTFAGEENEAIREALQETQAITLSREEKKKMLAASQELVNRARLGDQNAVGIIVGVRENAKKGSPRARAAFQLLLQICKAKPSKVSGETADGFFSSAVAALISALQTGATTSQKYIAILMSHVPVIGNGHAAVTVLADKGPKLTSSLLTETCQAQPTEQAQKAFVFAVKNSRDMAVLKTARRSAPPDAKRALAIGYVLGQAKLLQDMREPDAPIAPFSPIVAWELGEIHHA